MESGLGMPPLVVPGIFTGWGHFVVGIWKGSMQTPQERRTAGVLLGVGEPRLLQDFFQRSNHILGTVGKVLGQHAITC